MSSPSLDVVVVGSCNVDLISYIPKLPQKGETIHGTKFKMSFGGKGANQCVMSAKLGAKAAMIAKVGDDTYGKGFIQEFKRLNVNTDSVIVTDETSTGVAPCLVDENGASAIIIVSGANLLLTSQEVINAEQMIKSSKVMVCQLEITREATLTALKQAKKHGVKTIFNPAPKDNELPDEIYPLCDIFCPNETEVSDTPVTTIDEAGSAAMTYLDKGCGTVIVTLGEKGCVYVTNEDRRVVHVPCEPVNAIDTTGAGDSFVGSLAYFLSCCESLPLEEMIRRSCYIASVSVQCEGTQTSYPFKSELPTKLFENE